MTDLMDIARLRHTVRSYARRAVEPEKLAAVLEAGRWAPTATNAQPQRILVLERPESLEKVRAFCTFGWQKKYVDLAGECDTPGHNRVELYYGAPVVLVVCYDRAACWAHPASGETSGPTDAVIVATHMMLEAASLGLGSAWISYFDKGKARELLDIPESWEICSLLYLGYPSADEAVGHAPGKRLPLGETCFFDHQTLTETAAPSDAAVSLEVAVPAGCTMPGGAAAAPSSAVPAGGAACAAGRAGTTAVGRKQPCPQR